MQINCPIFLKTFSEKHKNARVIGVTRACVRGQFSVMRSGRLGDTTYLPARESPAPPKRPSCALSPTLRCLCS